MDAGKPGLGDDLRIAWERKGRNFGYACIAATVGLLLRSMEEHVGWLRGLVVKLIGVGWALATFVVVPVLATRSAPAGGIAGVASRHQGGAQIEQVGVDVRITQPKARDQPFVLVLLDVLDLDRPAYTSRGSSRRGALPCNWSCSGASTA
jgi:hypothetical protein